jgi:Bacterial SH3 domain
MVRRNCASCRFYERSSIARMGWCRHPEMYSEHHNHLVSADDLDCDRGTGNFWEPIRDDIAADSADRAWMTNEPKVISVTAAGSPVFPVSGSSGFSDDPPPPVPGGSGGPPWGNGDRDLGYYEEERYWADYIRIIAPIVGVILLVILLWFWIANFLGDDSDPNNVAVGTATIEVPTFAVTEEGTPAEGSTAIIGIPPTATTSLGGGPTSTIPAVPTTDGSGAPVGIYLGATVEVANTDGTGVNVRSEAATTSDVLTVFLDGTQVQVIDGPVDSEGFIWWQITGNEVAAGWIVDDYLVVVE